MEWLSYFLDILLHSDKHLADIFTQYGLWIYAILFLIIFAETGLVVTPFLPGDSLLFATGALAATGGFNPHLMVALLIVAAILGDTVNYWIGSYFGVKVFNKPKSRFFNPEHLRRTHAFYEKYGGKTIIFARFIPIIRTFAPFVAGIGEMSYAKFLSFNVIGGIVWVASFIYAGFWFGGMPIVKKNFTLVILAIIVISILPAVIEVWRHRRETKPVVDNV
ncbi:MAG: DedA family protein [Thiotrichaceae bacterium]|nr:DedA family protein [Thiotrichaceae bacterium]